MLLDNIILMVGAVVNKKVPTVDLGNSADEYYAIARLFMRWVYEALSFFGLGHNPTLFIWCYSILVFGISFLIGWGIQWIVVLVVDSIGKKWKNDVYQLLIHSHFFSKASRIFPALVFLILIQFTLTGRATLSTWLTRLTWVYVIYLVARSLNVLAMVLWAHFDARENTRHLPLKGLIQVLKGAVWILAIITMAAVIFDKSPASLLAGIGAFAAVLMLVFKDSILGVVAGVQLSENDSLHVGDWIKVSGTDANGIVTEVSLTAVKVQNWDKTITTVPPYNLVSGGFTNYKPMQVTNTRRISRSYMIDADSVLSADEVMLAEFAKIPLLAPWLEKKIEQQKAGKVEDVFNSEGLVDGSIETNLGIFRAYVKLYLDAHPNIHHDPVESDTFVCTLAQTGGGIPFQVYCFTTTSKWLPYEAIQSSIFEHLAIMLSKFHLYTFENASGRDELVNGVLEAGADPQQFYGLPYPFYRNSGTPDDPGAHPTPPSAPTTTTSNSDK